MSQDVPPDFPAGSFIPAKLARAARSRKHKAAVRRFSTDDKCLTHMMWGTKIFVELPEVARRRPADGTLDMRCTDE